MAVWTKTLWVLSSITVFSTACTRTTSKTPDVGACNPKLSVNNCPPDKNQQNGAGSDAGGSGGPIGTPGMGSETGGGGTPTQTETGTLGNDMGEQSKQTEGNPPEDTKVTPEDGAKSESSGTEQEKGTAQETGTQDKGTTQEASQEKGTAQEQTADEKQEKTVKTESAPATDAKETSASEKTAQETEEKLKTPAAAVTPPEIRFRIAGKPYLSNIEAKIAEEVTSFSFSLDKSAYQQKFIYDPTIKQSVLKELTARINYQFKYKNQQCSGLVIAASPSHNDEEDMGTPGVTTCKPQ